MCFLFFGGAFLPYCYDRTVSRQRPTYLPVFLSIIVSTLCCCAPVRWWPRWQPWSDQQWWTHPGTCREDMKSRSLLLLTALPGRGLVAATQEVKSLVDIWLSQNRIFWCLLHYCCCSFEYLHPHIPVESEGEGGGGGRVEEEPWPDMENRMALLLWLEDWQREKESGVIFIQSMLNQLIVAI